MPVKTIKGVDEKDWAEFKSLANESNMKMGDFFGFLVDNYKSKDKVFWNKVLNAEKTMNEKEAEELKTKIKKMRKSWGFRESARF